MQPEIEPLKQGQAQPEQMTLRPIQTLLSTNCFIDRYFTRYSSDPKAQVSQYLYLHTNGIVVIGIKQNQISPYRQQKISISYDCVTNNISDIVKGKKKKGGVKVQPNTVVAEITTQTDVIKVRALIDGFIVQFNEALLTQPKLLQESPQERGYIIVVMPRTHINPQKIGLIKNKPQ